MRRLFQALDRCGVRYLVIGGQATILYGAAHFSEDLDLWVEPREANLHRLLLALGRCRARIYKLTPPLTEENARRGHGFHFHLPPGSGPLRYLDIMGSPPRVGPFAPALRRGPRIPTPWGRLPVASIEDLVELKKTDRAADYDSVTRLVLARLSRDARPSTRLLRWALQNVFRVEELWAIVVNFGPVLRRSPTIVPAAVRELLDCWRRGHGPSSRGSLNYWGALLGYCVAYSALALAALAPGVTSRLLRWPFVWATRWVLRRWVLRHAHGSLSEEEILLLAKLAATGAGAFVGARLAMEAVPTIEEPAFYWRPHPDVSCHGLEANTYIAGQANAAGGAGAVGGPAIIGLTGEGGGGTGSGITETFGRPSVDEVDEKIRGIEEEITREQREVEWIRDKLNGCRPEDRDFWERQLRHHDANISNYRDNITHLRTGEYVHTRTAWDDYNARAMAERSAREAADYAARLQAIQDRFEAIRQFHAAAGKLDALDSFNMMTIGDRIIHGGGPNNPADISTIRRLTQIMTGRRMAGAMAEGAAADMDAAAANFGVEAAENIQTTANGAIMVGAMIAPGGSVIAGLYNVGTGAIHDGVRGALRGGVYAGLGMMGPAGQRAALLLGAGEAAYQGGVQGLALYGAGGFLMSRAGGLIQQGAGAIRGLGASGGGAPRVPVPRRTLPPTQMDYQLQNARARGARLIADYRETMNRIREAQTSGQRIPRDLIDTRRQQALAINDNYSARNQMKYDAPASTQNQFVRDQNVIHRYVRGQTSRGLREQGFSEQQIRDIRNQASGNSANMDYDFGVRGPNLDPRDPATIVNRSAFRSTFQQQGQRVSVHQYEQAGQRAAEDAYRRLGGDPRRGGVMFTSPDNPEALRNTRILGGEPGGPPISQSDFRQAGEVSRFKSNMVRNDPAGHGMTPAEGVQETLRGGSKALERQLQPHLNNPNVSDAERAHIQEMIRIGNAAGTGRMPLSEANRQLQDLTGGRVGIGNFEDGVADAFDRVGRLVGQ